MANILLVDDDMMIRDLLDKFLEDAGHAVLMAEDAETALELISQRPSWVDVVLSDMDMPGISGRSFMNILKTIRPSIPFVLMSASFTVNDQGFDGSYQVMKSNLGTIIEYVNKVTS